MSRRNPLRAGAAGLEDRGYEGRGEMMNVEKTPISLDNDLVSEIRGLLAERLLVEVDSPEADLLNAGVLDSLALIQLLVHLEEQFGVQIAVDALEIEDFRSITSIARLVAGQKARALPEHDEAFAAHRAGQL